ncbi:MAG: AzlD domain-containing protein, partial [Arcobacter sp.]|nr:AzlD domain-containing protein [Arcobacter sp.]
LKDIDFKTEFYGIKEIFGIFFTAILHLVFKNYLISIFVGTIFYMGLVQLL